MKASKSRVSLPTRHSVKGGNESELEKNCYPPQKKTNMTMEKNDSLKFEDVFPIEHGDFPMSC